MPNKSFHRRERGGRRDKSKITIPKNLESVEPLAKVGHSVIPGEPRIESGAGAEIQNRLKILDSGSRFACPE
jgi:hypothetical protein